MTGSRADIDHLFALEDGGDGRRVSITLAEPVRALSPTLEPTVLGNSESAVITGRDGYHALWRARNTIEVCDIWILRRGSA